MEVYAIIVNGYNVKFSKYGNIIRVTIPNHSCELNLETNRNLSVAFKKLLEDRDWSTDAIDSLNDDLLDEDEWISCINMDTETGEITWF